MLVLFALACGADNDHTDLTPPRVAEHRPDEEEMQDIAFEPAELDVGRVCTPTTTEVWVENAGTATLQLVSIAVSGAGWEVDLDGVPAQIVAHQSIPLPLRTQGGVAWLEVSSDDPDEPFVQVPLISTTEGCPNFGDTGDTGLPPWP